jgi:hypothetical protein
LDVAWFDYSVRESAAPGMDVGHTGHVIDAFVFGHKAPNITWKDEP